MEVVLDTSFLIYFVTEPSQGLNSLMGVLGKVEPIVLSSVVKELRRLAEGSSKRSKQARSALQFASKLKVVKVDEGENVDDSMVNYSMSKKVTVGTLDSGLKLRLRKISVPVVTLRGHALTVEGIH